MSKGPPEEVVEIRVQRKPGTEDLSLPDYQSAHAAGMDLYAAVEEDVVVEPGQICLVPTGLHIALPPGHEAQVRPRSGLALRHGLTVVNAPGTIDADYRGEVCVIVTVLGREPFIVKRGMRIAQMIISRVERARLVEVEELPSSDRGDGGFGHTGVHG